jgi:hypothetical protein
MQMLDLDRLKRDMHAVPGNVVAATKAQMDMLIDAAAEGQKAIKQLADLQKKSGALLVAA